MKTADVAWLAGLLEGEGSFGFHSNCPVIQLQMTDRDVVARAAQLMGIKLRAPWRRQDGYKWVWSCVASGMRATSWMMTLYSYLGDRRQGKVREVLSGWRALARAPRSPAGARMPADCHPERLRVGRGLCKNCYMRKYRAANPEKWKESARLDRQRHPERYRAAGLRYRLAHPEEVRAHARAQYYKHKERRKAARLANVASVVS